MPIMSRRPDFMSKLVHGLAFETPKYCTVPYGKINHGFVNLSSICDVKSGLRADASPSSDNGTLLYPCQ